MEGRFFLVPVGMPGSTPRHMLRPGRQIIGRSDRAALSIPERSVSRQHAAVEVDGGEVWVEDLGSKHGSFVNGQRVTRRQLHVGDLLVLGVSVVLRLDMELRRASDQTFPVRILAGAEVQPGAASALGACATDPAGLAAEAKLPEYGSSSAPSDLDAVGRLCMATLPALYARLTLIVDQLGRLAEQPRAQADPGRVAQWIEPVLEGMTRLMSGVRAPTERRLVILGDVISAALRLAGPSLGDHQVVVDQQVPPGLAVHAHPGLLAETLGLLLMNAGERLEPGQVVVLGARASEDSTEVEIRLPGGLLLDEEGELMRRVRTLALDAGVELSVAAGRVQLLLGPVHSHSDEYSSS